MHIYWPLGQPIKLHGPSNDIVISGFYSSGLISELSFDKAFFSASKTANFFFERPINKGNPLL